MTDEPQSRTMCRLHAWLLSSSVLLLGCKGDLHSGDDSGASGGSDAGATTLSSTTGSAGTSSGAQTDGASGSSGGSSTGTGTGSSGSTSGTGGGLDPFEICTDHGECKSGLCASLNRFDGNPGFCTAWCDDQEAFPCAGTQPPAPPSFAECRGVSPDGDVCAIPCETGPDAMYPPCPNGWICSNLVCVPL